MRTHQEPLGGTTMGHAAVSAAISFYVSKTKDREWKGWQSIINLYFEGDRFFKLMLRRRVLSALRASPLRILNDKKETIQPPKPRTYLAKKMILSEVRLQLKANVASFTITVPAGMALQILWCK